MPEKGEQTAEVTCYTITTTSTFRWTFPSLVKIALNAAEDRPASKTPVLPYNESVI